MNLIKRVLRHDSRQPPVPHALQRGHGRHHPSLCDGGSGNKIGHGVTWPVNTGLGSVFYAKNGIFYLTQPERLHREFEVLTVLFDRVGLRTNMWKMVSMACQSCQPPGRIFVDAYERQRIETGPTFWEIQRRRVECP